jgi:hypothetical protein
VLALDYFETADSAADIYAYALRIVRVDPKPGLLQCEFRGGDSELNEPAHLLDLFALDIPVGLEILDFTGNPASEVRRVELLDAGDPVPPLADGLPGFRCTDA